MLGDQLVVEKKVLVVVVLVKLDKPVMLEETIQVEQVEMEQQTQYQELQ